jgi:transcriptional regulator with XRE-family HTH domain
MTKREALFRLQRHIGELLREARLAANLTQMQLARLTDMNQSHLSEVETGKPNITRDTICTIAIAVGKEPVFGLLDRPTGSGSDG